MCSSYSSLDYVLSHWVHFTVHSLDLAYPHQPLNRLFSGSMSSESQRGGYVTRGLDVHFLMWYELWKATGFLQQRNLILHWKMY